VEIRARGNRIAPHAAVSIARATSCHYCPRWLTALWLVLGLVALVLASACRRDTPVARATKTVPRATISGTVRGAEGADAVSGRTLEIIDIATGHRTVVQTSSSGGFSVAVPAGRYRLEMSLHAGEKLIKRPELLDLNRGGADATIELIVGPVHATRPKGPAYQLDNGLGSPIA
jgi:hypothetical protein